METAQTAFEYEENDTGITLTRFLDGPDVLVVPGEIDGKKVTAIGPECFRENGIMLTEITLPETVKELKNDAFAYTVSLERLHLPESLEKIGADFLIASGLQEAYIPAGVNIIERPELIDRTFKVSPDNGKFFSDGYGLYERDGDVVTLVAVDGSKQTERYDIDEEATHIALNALRDASAIGILGIPKSLVCIKEGALSYNGGVVNENKGVRSVEVDRANEKFVVCSDILCERLDNDSLKIIRYFGGETAKIPEQVSVIGFESFKNSDINKLIITDNVKEIKKSAFAGCPLKELVINDSVASFGDEDRFTMESMLEQFGVGGKIYDFDMLDNFLIDEYITPGRIRMMCARLKYPRDLSGKAREQMINKISGELKTVIEMLASEKDISTVEDMGALGFFNADNIDGLIDMTSNADEKELTAWFMTYKNNNIRAKSGFDFSL